MEKIAKIDEDYRNDVDISQNQVIKIKGLHNIVFKLNLLRKLEKIEFNDDEIFEFLKDLALTDANSEIRYMASKIIYKNYPEKSKSLIKWLLMNDSNYNFRIINFSKSKRNNFSDIINSSIEKTQNREKMLSEIIDNDFERFVLSWKDYSNDVQIFYDLDLRCFILYLKKDDYYAYFCRRATDPFQSIPINTIISISKIRKSKDVSKKVINTIIVFLKKFLGEKKRELQLASLTGGKINYIPRFKVFSRKHEFIIYFGSEGLK